MNSIQILEASTPYLDPGWAERGIFVDSVYEHDLQPLGVRTYFDTDEVEGKEALHFAQRVGRSCEMTARAILCPRVPRKTASLVHGSVWDRSAGSSRVADSWLILDADMIWEPTRAMLYPLGQWYTWMRARDERTYTWRGAAAHIITRQSFGRWHRSEFE